MFLVSKSEPANPNQHNTTADPSRYAVHRRRSCSGGKSSNFEIYHRIYTEYFAGEGNPNPTRTTTEINRLPMPMAVEVKAVAHVPWG